MNDPSGDRARLLIVGLGNPGRRYARTRHNVGFELVERLARVWRTSFVSGPVGGPPLEIARAVVRDAEVLLVKPLAYMNRSGLVVAAVVTEHGLDASECLVIVDDMALPVGRIRFRPRGSAGGHNGLASIEERLGTQEYPRLRIGIGPAPSSEVWADFVLRPFEPEERSAVDDALDRAARGLERLIESDIERAMSEYNG